MANIGIINFNRSLTPCKAQHNNNMELFKELEIERKAWFSHDRKKRYSLTRTWDASKGHVMFIGLNPSTANQHNDDPHN